TIEKLTAASHKLAEAMYKQAAPSGGAGPSAQAGAGAAGATDSGAHGKAKGEGEVIDAEVVDSDDKKKN
ncbi:MAG TPA: molecular chaperone DnaK, partial [Terriglobia bacterium]|nr:molecular chaperone DnaK [Terriglobia bacterium]